MGLGDIKITVSPEMEDLANRGINAMQELTKAILGVTCLVRELRPSKEQAEKDADVMTWAEKSKMADAIRKDRTRVDVDGVFRTENGPNYDVGRAPSDPEPTVAKGEGPPAP